jgi:predicted enzyme related to lactoylglutathione lyase
MEWRDGSARNYQDNLGKLVLNTTDVATTVGRVTQAGGQVVQPPAADASGTTVALTKDLDGTLVELRQR